MCKDQEGYLRRNYSYSCINDLINSNLIKYDYKGNLLLKANFTNGVLNGIYEQYSGGRLERYLEFRNGNLEGKVYELSSGGKLKYEGQYINGLQEGIFTRYASNGDVESEVVFENGKIIKINIH